MKNKFINHINQVSAKISAQFTWTWNHTAISISQSSLEVDEQIGQIRSLLVSNYPANIDES